MIFRQDREKGGKEEGKKGGRKEKSEEKGSRSQRQYLQENMKDNNRLLLSDYSFPCN